MSSTGQNIALAGLIAAVAAAAFISFNNILTTQVYTHGGSPVTLVVLRYVGLLAVTGIWVASFERAAKCSPYEFRMCLVVGAVYAFAAAALLNAISYLPVSLAILIFYIFPLLTLIFESALDRKMPSPVTLGAMVAALTGLAVAAGIGPVALNPVGIMYSSLAAVCASAGFILSGRKLRGVKPVVMIYQTSKAGLVAALIFLLAEGRGFQVGSTPVFWAVLTGGIATFGIAYYFMFAGIRLIGATRTSMVMNLEPVFTAILSAIILLETLSLPQVGGAALVVLSVVVAQIWARPAAPAQ